MKDIPAQIKTPRLWLERMDIAHACDLYEIYRQPQAVRWLSFPPHVSVEETLAALRDCYMQEGLFRPYVIVEAQKERFIGTIDLHHPISPRQMMIGYVLHPAYWHQGYMQEAMQAMLYYSFHQWGLIRLFAQCATKNAPSIRLLQRCGFRLEGTTAQQVLLGDGRYYDTLLYSLSEQEWRKQYEKGTGGKI